MLKLHCQDTSQKNCLKTELFKRTQQFFTQKLNDFSPKTQGILAKTQFFGKSEILICRQPGQMETLN